MNRITKTMKKGFTLVELMVVMAIMSILLLAMMSITTPVSKIYKRTSVSETVYATADNITNYLQRSLEYADNVWVFDASQPEAGVNGAKIKNTAEEFMKCYYNHVIKGKGEGSAAPGFVDGKIRVIRLNNSDGKLYENVYDFNSADNFVNENGTWREVLNPVYFQGEYLNYNIRYALCSSSLEHIGETDKGESIYNLKAEKDGATMGGTVLNQAVTIIANRGAVPSGSPMQFEGPCVATVANLPFTNITARGNAPASRLFVEGDNPATGTIHTQSEAITGYEQKYTGNGRNIEQSFANLSEGEPVSFNDIYFMYAYADELKVS